MITFEKITEKEFKSLTLGLDRDGTWGGDLGYASATLEELAAVLSFAPDREIILDPEGESVLSSYHCFVRTARDAAGDLGCFEVYDYDYYCHGLTERPYTDASEREWHFRLPKGSEIMKHMEPLLQEARNTQQSWKRTE